MTRSPIELLWTAKNPQKAQLLARPVIMDLTIIIDRVRNHLVVFLTSDLTWDKQIANITKKVKLDSSALNYEKVKVYLGKAKHL